MSDPSEGTNPLRATLTDEQQAILKLLLDTFNEYRSWPLWQYVEQKCDDAGFDGATVLASLPLVGSKQGFYGLTYGLTWTQGTLGASHQPGDPIGLTVVGLYRTGAMEYVDLFLEVLKLANQKLRAFVPDPTQVVSLELTSSEVFGQAIPSVASKGLSPQELYMIMEHEPPMWTGGRGTLPDGSWRWEVARALRRYSDVQDIDGYIRAVTELAEESARQVAQAVPFASSPSWLATNDLSLDLSDWTGSGNPYISPHIPLLGSGIDSELWEHVRILAEDGRWEEVARESAAFVEIRTREWTGSKKEVLDLMTELLKPAKSSSSKELAIATSEQEGWHLFARGFFMAVRNHIMHNSVGVEEQLQYGLGSLGAASLLIRQIRQSVQAKSGNDQRPPDTPSASQQSAQ
jgi:hypothetical protein